MAQIREADLISKELERRGIACNLVSALSLATRFHDKPELQQLGENVVVLVPRSKVDATMDLFGHLHYVVNERDPLSLIEFDKSRLRVRAREEWPSGFDGHAQADAPITALEWLGHATHRLTRRGTWSLSRALDVISIARKLTQAGWEALPASVPAAPVVTELITAAVACFDVLEEPRPPGLDRAFASLRTQPGVPSIEACLQYSSRGSGDEWSAQLKAAGPVADLGRFSPTPMEVVERMLSIAAVTSSDVVVDLGCGDGRLIVAAALRHNARAIGVDLDPQRVDHARAAITRAGVGDRARVDLGDLRAADIGEASVVCLYLQPLAYGTIESWLRSALKPGSRIVSHEMVFPGWLPTSAEVVAWGGGRASMVFVWTV